MGLCDFVLWHAQRQSYNLVNMRNDHVKEMTPPNQTVLRKLTSNVMRTTQISKVQRP